MKPPGEPIEFRVGEPMPGTKWVVRGKLGEGGMGVVLDVVKADFLHGAMKVLLPHYAQIPALAARFLDEVKLTATLQHPNLVHVLDFDRLQDGTPFMVMERLRGRTLRAALRETAQRGRTWTPENAYAVAAHVCQGLARAHAHVPSIVHRDIKPENIFLHRPEGRVDPVVKVMDFGIAAVAGDGDRSRVGTPRYMAPEQLQGDRISPQTDQYALALVVYEMLTGRWPWPIDVRDVAAVAEANLHMAPEPPSAFCPSLPPSIDAAILKALAKNPDQRHASVHGLLFELRALHQANPPRAGAVDTLLTDPMVGTLADGYPPVREEPDTIGPATLAPWEGPTEGAARAPVEASAPTAARRPPSASAAAYGTHAVGEPSVSATVDPTLYAADAASQVPRGDSTSLARPAHAKAPRDAASSHPLPKESLGSRPPRGRRGSAPALVAVAAIAGLAAAVGAYVRKGEVAPTLITRLPPELPSSVVPEVPPTATREAPVESPAPFPVPFPRPDKLGDPWRMRGPCEGCRAYLPGGSDPRPLLVLLHGDNETAASMFDAWVPAAAARAVAVLAIACPRAEGCTTQSWWQWNGDPDYLLLQVRAVARSQRIDPDRLWIVGWSGGASYIGYRTQEIERSFAAIVIHGGGMRPADAACSIPQASVYFLVGDANPLHNLAVQLRDYYVGCHHDVTWTLLHGADHPAERRALASRQASILDWLASKRLSRPSGASAQPTGIGSVSASP